MTDGDQPRVEEAHKKHRAASTPLETRHVFLDTQVYYKLKHNPANRALKLLAEQVAARIVALHVTDITLAEIKRQIADEVEQSRAAIARLEKDLRRWRITDPAIGEAPALSTATADRLFGAMRTFLEDDCRAKRHLAMAHPAAAVFADYFERKPPFDKGEKEFPDSFMVKTLDAWCAANGERMYVVTQDGAMQRHVAASPNLILLPTIEDLLGAASVSAEPDGEAERIADELLNAPEFDHHLEQAIASHEDELIVDYRGDLPEGEVTGVNFEGVIKFLDYRIVARSAGRISLLVNADTEIVAAVSYEDRSLASYDREDDVWIGAGWETTDVRDGIMLEMFLELDIASGRIVASELLRTEYSIYR
ncbi:MAG: hypothetical protein JWR80_1823 [Bradyrhizobium sp.]|nr:hypothetical protein [Bradyrhizobium sp.]